MKYFFIICQCLTLNEKHSFSRNASLIVKFRLKSEFWKSFNAHF